MLRYLILFALALQVGVLDAQSLWSDVSEASVQVSGERQIVPSTYRMVQLHIPNLQTVLQAAPGRNTPNAQENSPTLQIPMPDGSTSAFRLFETPVMAPALQAKYPEIRCYTGVGIDDPGSVVKVDFTQRGFHAMILSKTEGTVYIDPYANGNQEYYVVYNKKDYLPKKSDSFACLAEPEAGIEIKEGVSTHPADEQAEWVSDCQLRTYRLALACTGEYAQFHGGSVPSVLAAMNTTMNRVNGIYENDFAVTMEIIANNDEIVYLDAGTDPYTNNSGSTMLGQNVSNLNSVIGSANYDIGHVFSTGGGGIAGLRVVCTSNKARGVTGGGSPVGDPFDVDYVAHEMGHQFGGNHTQNNNCNRVASASMEPGSASTIMGYAGICNPNVQSNSDDYFHAISMQEIGNYITNNSGNNCPVKTVTGNNAPVVNAGANYTIPRSTPFALTADASDADGDAITYNWEQMDPEFATMPPVSSNTGGPMFRSFKAVDSPTRYFPRLSDLVNNTNFQWEELPSVARNMNFRVTVRDNYAGAGCTDEDDMVVTVTASSGPFVVTAPNTLLTWLVGSPETITWDVADTDMAPVSCANVQIYLSTDGGFTYPILVADNVPNIGTALINVPNVESTQCRIMVKGAGNIFFDISDENFTIELPPVPTFVITTDPASDAVCAGDSVNFTIQATAILGFADPVDFSVTGAPAGATVNVSPVVITPDGEVTVTISGLTTDMAGDYTLEFSAISGAITRTGSANLTVYPGAPAVTATQVSPLNGELGASSMAVLSWGAVPFAAEYHLQVATSPTFSVGSLIADMVLADTFASVSTPDAETIYYWQVQAGNLCGNSDVSAIWAFQTGTLDCGHVFESADIPQTIDDVAVNTAVSTLEITDAAIVGDVNVSLSASHSWVGDLGALLISPSGDSSILFDQPGVPADQFGCNGDDASLTFDDDAFQTAAQLEDACNPVPPALNGSFQPIGSLAAFNGTQLSGTWTLQVSDSYAEDGGSLDAWSLEFCYVVATPDAALINNNVLQVPTAGTGTITTALLEAQLTGTSDQGLYTIMVVPQNGTLMLSGMALGLGDSFTQADIDNGNLSYEHNGNASISDNFTFHCLDQNNGAWFQNGVFQIEILTNTLAATAAVVQELDCFGDSDGQIEVSLTGGYDPFTYSLNGGADQSSPLFENLPAGDYTVVITDNFGFTAETGVITIASPDELTVSGSVDAAVVTATGMGGTGNLEYSLNGVDFQSGNEFTNVSNGIYTLTVMDENGCTATTEVIVAVDAIVATTSVESNVSCNGLSDGSISVTAAGGIAPLQYSINGVDFQSDPLFENLPAGSYTVTVMDAVGTTSTSNPVDVSEPTLLNGTTSVTLNVITVDGMGGTAPYEYSFEGGAFSDVNVFPGLANGTYSIEIQDANGCTITLDATVNVAALAFSGFTADQILCFGGTTTVTLEGQGGIPPYEYSIDGGAFQSSNEFTGVGAGLHTLTIKDAVGTEVSVDLTISEPTALTAAVNIVGNDIDALTAAGGTPPYTYVLDPALPTDLMDIPNGTYTIMVTDANGCTYDLEFTIDYTVVSGTASGTNLLCNGDASGVITAAGANGTAPYQYALDGGAFQADGTFTGLGAGMYTITIQDAIGDEFTVNVTLTEPVAINATADVVMNTITVTANGGTAPLMYSINGTDFQASEVFADLANGSYDVTVMDANGCTFVIENVMVVVDGTQNLASEWGLVIMPNPSAGLFRIHMTQAPGGDLQADVLDATGRLLNTQIWTGTNIQQNIDLSNLPQGNYTLRIRSKHGVAAVRLSVIR
ncbi:MAG: zinc-dependent metalloprotease family protein [Saprospiraceae bacterium]